MRRCGSTCPARAPAARDAAGEARSAWNEAGVWQRLHEVLLGELNTAARLDWSRRVVDSSHVRALKGGSHTGPSPVDRGRPGSKHRLISDGHGTPLAILLTGGNRNDVIQLLPLLDAIPPVRGRVGRPRRKPDSLFADCGYDHDVYRDQVRARGIVRPSLAVEHAMAPGWVPTAGDRKELRVAARLPAPTDPLGTSSRHPRSVPETRLLPDHSPTTQLIVLAVVSLGSSRWPPVVGRSLLREFLGGSTRPRRSPC